MISGIVVDSTIVMLDEDRNLSERMIWQDSERAYRMKLTFDSSETFLFDKSRKKLEITVESRRNPRAILKRDLQ